MKKNEKRNFKDFLKTNKLSIGYGICLLIGSVIIICFCFIKSQNNISQEYELTYEDLVEITEQSSFYQVYDFITMEESKKYEENPEIDVVKDVNSNEVIDNNTESYIYYIRYTDTDDYTRFNKAYKCTIKKYEESYEIYYEVFRASYDLEIIDEEPFEQYIRTVQFINPIILNFINE